MVLQLPLVKVSVDLLFICFVFLYCNCEANLLFWPIFEDTAIALMLLSEPVKTPSLPWKAKIFSNVFIKAIIVLFQRLSTLLGWSSQVFRLFPRSADKIFVTRFFIIPVPDGKSISFLLQRRWNRNNCSLYGLIIQIAFHFPNYFIIITWELRKPHTFFYWDILLNQTIDSDLLSFSTSPW